jgi:nucleotide-binding universal stress UspA family protein
MVQNFSERALPMALELACTLKAQLVLVCVAGDELQLHRGLTDEDRKAVSEQYANIREEDHLLSTEPGIVERAQEQVRAVAQAEEYLANTAARLLESGLHIEVTVPFGAALEGILTEIDLHSADLVVMSTHERSGIIRLISGSVASAVLAHSPVPVLLVPPERKPPTD